MFKISRQRLPIDRPRGDPDEARLYPAYPDPCRVQPGRVEGVQTVTLDVNNKAYAKLLVKVLPQPIRDDREHARLTEMLLGLDERDDLTPEEEALAEVLTLLIEDYGGKTLPYASGIAKPIAASARGRTRIEA